MLPKIHEYISSTDTDWCEDCYQAKDYIGHKMYAQLFMEYTPEKEDSMDFETKDSGQRQEFSTGMRRDIQKDKARYDLIWQPGLKRLAELMARGAEKYSERNWEKASTQEELDRFKASAYRHFMQWFNGETDEDHMSGTIFNLFGAEFVKEKLH